MWISSSGGERMKNKTLKNSLMVVLLIITLLFVFLPYLTEKFATEPQCSMSDGQFRCIDGKLHEIKR